MKFNLPVMVLKGIILLPNNDIRLEFDKDIIKNIIDESISLYNSKILIVNDEDFLEENIKIEKLPKYGVVAYIKQFLELPNNKIRIIISGENRAIIHEYINNSVNNKLEAAVEYNEKMNLNFDEEEILLKKLSKEVHNYIEKIPYVSNSIISILDNQNNLDIATDIVAHYLQLSSKRMIQYLKENNCKIRLEMILEDIYKEQDACEIETALDIKIRQKIDQNQREYILREKIKEIKEELGEKSLKENDVLFLEEKLKELKADNKIKDRIALEIKRYENIPSTSPEVDIIRNYIDWMLSLPWNKYTIDNDDLNDVMENLNKSHGSLTEVKNRIIEYLAVKKFTNNLRAPIICLVGPPGVGKTSLANSIANAMHRNFAKISVGGINDEAEIIGHRKTYIGASPGRIISSLKKIESSNPVFLIDEIDKMTKTIKGDPASTLLEVLDPEQNKHFMDNYISEEYDLSKVLFILTANYIDDIPEALKDRLEIIKLTGYTDYEKLEIAKDYLIPKICKEHGLNVNSIKIKDEDILNIIKKYTKESGVRELERIISKIIRKVIFSLSDKRIKSNYISLNSKKINEYLGKEKYVINFDNKKSLIGVVNALAYTPYGGLLLPIETNCFKGNGNITITGLIGDVMKESTLVALSYIKSNYKKFNLNYNELTNNDIHIHIPEGAISKDGPSAGIALTTSLISLFSEKKVNKSIAMTGEITLRGNVLAVGGLKEKIIGAYQNGIKKIILPISNKHDVDDLPIELKENMKFIFVKDYSEVYKEVFYETK